MNIANPKNIVKIVLYFFLFFSIYFFMFYNEKTSQHNQIYSYGDTKNTYKVALTSDMNQADMLKTIYPILNDYKANLSLFVSESSQDKNKNPDLQVGHNRVESDVFAL